MNDEQVLDFLAYLNKNYTKTQNYYIHKSCKRLVDSKYILNKFKEEKGIDNKSN